MFGIYLIFIIVMGLFILKEVFFYDGEDKKQKSTNSKFGKLIYENPVIGAVIMNLTALLISMYFINNNMSYMYFYLIFVGFGTRKILDKGINLTKSKRLIIVLSFFIMIGCFSSYSIHIHNLKTNEILKSLQ